MKYINNETKTSTPYESESVTNNSMSKIREVYKSIDIERKYDHEPQVDRMYELFGQYHNLLLSAVIEEVEGEKSESPAYQEWNACADKIITKLKEGKL